MKRYIWFLVILVGAVINLNAQTIEVVYRWESPASTVDKVVYERLTKTMTPTNAHYYYIMYGWAKDDILLSQSPGRSNQGWLPEKILLDGKEITREEYKNIIDFGPAETYRIVYYQQTPAGLLKLGEQLPGRESFNQDIRFVEKVASQIGEKTEFSLWHWLGVLIAGGGVIQHFQKESEKPEVPPTAVLSVTPAIGTLSTNFYLDASSSYDPHQVSSGLLVRWDYTNDGVWDTDYDYNKSTTYQYPAIGNYTAKIEVKDGVGFTSTATASVLVIANGSGLLNSPSPMFHRNLVHNGLSPYTGPATNTLKWSLTTTGNIESSPAIDNLNNIYFTSYDGNLYKITPSGSPVWGAPYSVGGLVHSSPAIAADGTIYVGSGSGVLHAVNSNGTLKWTYPIGSWLKSSPAIGPDGTVYIGSINGYLYAINYNGTFQWSRQCGTWIESSPAVGPDGTIYVGSADGKLYALYPNSVIKWTYPTGGAIYSSPTLAGDGTVYIGSSDKYLYALAPNGTLKWRYQTGGAIYSSCALDAAGQVYFGSDDNKLYGLSAAGTPVAGFPFTSGADIRSSPSVDANGTIYVGSDDGKLYCISPTGTVNWDYAVGQPVRATPVIAASAVITPVVYVGANDQKLYAIGQNPIDPAEIYITKKANKTRVTVGDVVTYQITVSNITATTDKSNQTLIDDRIPSGFKYIKGSAQLDGNKIQEPTGQTILTFDVGVVAPGETKILSYQLVVGSGVSFGKYENKAICRYLDDQWKTSNTAREEVVVIPDPLFDLGTIIGKVFEDKNNNGVQDDGEKGIARVEIMMEDGTVVTTDKDGKYHIPGVAPGVHLLKLQGTSNQAQVVRVTEGLLYKVNFLIDSKDSLDSLDLILLGDGVIGYNQTSGNLAPVKSRLGGNIWDKGFYGSGRLAGYLKARTDDWQITSSLDTQRVSSDAPRPSGLLRYIDPDKYYLTYGDNSKIDWTATNTQGPVYFRAEHLSSGSSFLVGNYQTDLGKTELATYHRTLYGIKSEIRIPHSESRIPNSEIKVFAAQARALSAHNEIRATGGVFYYLQHHNLIEGSEQVRIEIRDKITNLPILTNYEERITDYEIDYSNGRITFTKPVASVDASNNLISTSLLNGNPVYIVVDYEYEPDRTHWNKGSYGARVTQQLPLFGAGLQIGGTYIQEETADKNYKLKGTNLVFPFTPSAFVKIEYAESDSLGIPNYLSNDGGLSFSNIRSDKDTGAAYRINTEISALKTYYERVQPGFISSGTVNRAGTEKYGLLVSQTLLGDKLTLTGRYDTQELLRSDNLATRFPVGAQKTVTTSLGGLYKPNNQWTLSGEYRNQEAHIPVKAIESESNQDTSLVAGRVERRFFGGTFTTYLGQQATLKGETNHQTTCGASANIIDPQTMDNVATARLEAINGTQGNAQLVGIETKLNEFLTLVSNYTQGVSREDGNYSALTLGTSHKIDEATKIYTQQEYRKSETSEATTQGIGVDKKMDAYWRLSGNFEKSYLQNYDLSETDRYTASTGLGYYSKPLVFNTRLEVRYDENTSGGDRDQHLTANSFKWTSGERNLYLEGRFNWAETRNQSTDKIDALYREYGLGLGYRPVNWDKLNLLAKYAYLVDDLPTGQTDTRADIYSLETAYDVTSQLQVVEKYALKDTKETVGRHAKVDSQTTLWLNRLNYTLLDGWTAGLEYRILEEDLAEDTKSGWLAEILYKIADNFRVGVGYNFTDFSDDLILNNDYTVKGPFVRLVVTMDK